MLALAQVLWPAENPWGCHSHFGFILAPKLSNAFVSDHLSPPDLPQEILQDKDGLNQRYFRKRALYLAHLAHHLAQDPVFGSVRFSFTNGCHLKPSLLLRPHGGRHTLGWGHSMR